MVVEKKKGKMNSFWTSYLLMIPKADSIFAAISHINTYTLIVNLLLNIHPKRLCFMLYNIVAYDCRGGVRQKQRISRRKRRATYKTIKKVSPKKTLENFFSLSFLFFGSSLNMLWGRENIWERDEIFGWEIMKCFCVSNIWCIF